MDKQPLLEKLKDKTAVIGIIGLGYVGLPLMLRYSEVGYKVIGFDIDTNKTGMLNEGRSYIKHLSSTLISEAVARGFQATTDFARTAEADALIICVPTPLNKFREPNLDYIISTMSAMGPYLRKGQVISLESTTYPGTTEEELRPRIEKSGLEIGRDIFLVYSPEREDPSNPHFTTKTIPKICGGSTESCLEVGVALYGEVIDQVVPVSSTKVAEMTKLLENIHRAVNIGLVNEMKMVADRMGIDIHEVIRGAATKPFGFVPYQPGPGLGGHCIPIDPFYLTWKAREFGIHTRFIELAGEVNSFMPTWVVGKIIEGMNNQGKAVRGTRILILGVAYKKNVDDMRESPAVEIMEQLEKMGAVLKYSDPHVASFPRMRNHSFNLESVPIKPHILEHFDCVVLVTDHDEFDYELIRKHSKLLVDTRGKYHSPSPKLISA